MNYTLNVKFTIEAMDDMEARKEAQLVMRTLKESFNLDKLQIKLQKIMENKPAIGIDLNIRSNFKERVTENDIHSLYREHRF